MSKDRKTTQPRKKAGKLVPDGKERIAALHGEGNRMLPIGSHLQRAVVAPGLGALAKKIDAELTAIAKPGELGTTAVVDYDDAVSVGSHGKHDPTPNGKCRICGCGDNACVFEGKSGYPTVCSWYDAEQTLCTNPKCLKKAGINVKNAPWQVKGSSKSRGQATVVKTEFKVGKQLERPLPIADQQLGFERLDTFVISRLTYYSDNTTDTRSYCLVPGSRQQAQQVAGLLNAGKGGKTAAREAMTWLMTFVEVCDRNKLAEFIHQQVPGEPAEKVAASLTECLDACHKAAKGAA